MARIRTIKPEFWVSEQVGECSPNARLLFIGMWNFCDDRGVHPAKPKTLRAEIFPQDEGITSSMVVAWVDELLLAGLIVVFDSDGAAYWHVTGWSKHQRIDRPSNKHPTPPVGNSAKALRIIAERSPTVPQPLADISASDPIAFAPVMEWNGMEGKGKEGCREGEKPSALSAEPTSKAPKLPACPSEAIVALYHEVLPTLPRCRLMPLPRVKALRKFWAWVLNSTKSDGNQRATTAEEALTWFRGYFERAGENDFLMGRTPRSAEHTHWQCDLDFLLSEKGMKQVIEKTQDAT